MEERKAIDIDLSGEPASVTSSSLDYFPIDAESTSSAVAENLSSGYQQKTTQVVAETKINQKAKVDERPFPNHAETNFQKNPQRIKKNKPLSAKTVKEEKFDLKGPLIETAAPIESVKEVVTKYGGIIDWKAHKMHTIERSEYVQSELEKLQVEIPECKRQSKAAEITKAEVLKELEKTNKITEELKIKLEKIQTEEAQAKQDLELAQLRAKEVEQGIAGQSSTAVKAQQVVAKTRHEAAVAELKNVKEELKHLQEDYVSLVNERDLMMINADEAVLKSKEFEKTVEELTLHLITMKESLDSAHSAQLEAEEHKARVALEQEQDCFAWHKEMMLAEEKAKLISEQISSKEDLQIKLDSASSLLQNLKAELGAYMQAKLKQESASILEEKVVEDIEGTNEAQHPIDQLVSTQKELEKVKADIEKAKEEVNCLNVAASSLKTELDKEKEYVTNRKQQEGVATMAIRSLAAELDRTKHELEVIKVKEKEAREKMVELPKLLQQAALDADKSKSELQLAKAELQSAKEELEQAKASAITMETRLCAVLKEINAVKASEKLALSAIQALHESEQNANITCENSLSVVSLPLDEYFDLSKKAHEAEELAHERIAAAMTEVEAAKKSEAKSIDRLVEAYKEMSGRKDALKLAKEKALKAKVEKMGIEKESRKVRADGKMRRKVNDPVKGAVNPTDSPRRSLDQNNEINRFTKHEADGLVPSVHDQELVMSGSNPEADVHKTNIKRKKKSLFPRMFVFLAMRNRSQQSNGHS